MATEKEFVKEFNKRLGQFTGLARESAPSGKKVSSIGRAENFIQATALSELLMEKAAQRGQAGSGVTYDPVVGNLNQPAIDTITENADFQAPDSSNFLSNIPLVGDALTKIPGAGVLDKAWDSSLDLLSPLADPATRALDVISRPAYGVFEAMKEASESANEGQRSWESIDDVLGGFVSGISGKEKTGFGEVIEENSKRGVGGAPDPFSYLLAPTSALGEWTDPGNESGAVNTWTKRALGLGGEVGLDPLNFVGIGLIGKLGNAAGDFARYSDDALKALARSKTDELLEAKGLKNLFQKPTRITGGVGADGKKLGARWAQANNLAGDQLDELIADAVDRTTLEVSRTGRVLGGDIAPYTVASKVGENIRQVKFADFDSAIDEFTQHLNGTKPLTVKEMNVLRQNPDFVRFQDEYLKIANSNRSANPFKSVDEALEYYQKEGKLMRASVVAKKAAITTKQTFDDTIAELQDELYDSLVGQVYNAPGIRVGSKKYDVPGLDRVGRAYADFRRTKLTGDASKALSFNRQNPGRLALMNQRIRSTGIRRYEDFLKGGKDGLQKTGNLPVRTMARRFTRAQREELTRALLKNQRPNDPLMAEGFDFLKDEYDRMFREEVDAGARAVGTANGTGARSTASNYTYLYYQGKRSSKIRELRQLTKERIRATGRIPVDQIDIAHKMGLKVEQDAFRNLLLRKLKSNRDLTRSWYTEDLLDHFGIRANSLTKEAANARKLSRIDSNIPIHVRKGMNQGDAWYLPKDIKEVYDNYTNLLKMGYNDETADFIRMYDRVTRLFKGSATIPYLGFHIRNSIGDMFMSWMDGVRYKDYAWLARMKANDVNPNKISQALIGDRNFTYDELRTLFRENASSGGFYSTDIGVDDVAGLGTRVSESGQKIRSGARRTGEAVRNASEHREDFFRFAHFLKAFKDEYPAALKNTKNADNALLNAIEASTYRVNKYLFDYGALTATERNVLRRAIPFYTYSRKVMPTLIEAVFLNPSQLAKTNRLFFDSNRPESNNFDEILVPDWQREIGYARLTDEPEPWTLGAQFLPTDVFRSNLDFSDTRAWTRNLLSQLNPMPKGVAEYGLGVKSFNEAPIESGPGYFTDAFVPPVAALEDLVGQGTKQGLERIISGRIGLGLPFSKLSEDRQTASLYGLQEGIYDEIGKVNGVLEQKGLRLYLSKRKDGATFRIRDEETGKVIFESNDPNETAKRGLELARNR